MLCYIKMPTQFPNTAPNVHDPLVNKLIEERYASSQSSGTITYKQNQNNLIKIIK